MSEITEIFETLEYGPAPESRHLAPEARAQASGVGRRGSQAGIRAMMVLEPDQEDSADNYSCLVALPVAGDGSLQVCTFRPG